MRKKSISLGYTEGWLSVVLNTALFGLKYSVGLASGSVAMVADAWHTLSDTLTSVIVILGFWGSSRPADKKHPFGHGRAEVIASIVISTLLAVVGVNFLWESVRRLRNFRAARFTVLAIIVFLASAVLKEALAKFSFWAGRKIRSKSLIADGWHHRSDAIASALIVVGALAGRKFWWVDGVMGLLVSLLIWYAAYDILKAALNSLLGEEPPPELEKQVKTLIGDLTPAASNFHHFHIHRYGEHTEITFHLDLPADMDLHEAHFMASRVERAIREEMKIETTIHLEPRRKEKK